MAGRFFFAQVILYFSIAKNDGDAKKAPAATTLPYLLQFKAARIFLFKYYI